MLKVDNLTFSYRKTGPVVLDDVSFMALPGQMIALLGENGAGKSTLFRCLLGLEPVRSGTVTFDGMDLRRLTRREIASLMAYVPQSESPVFQYSVFETVLMGTTGSVNLFSSPGPEQILRARNAIDALGISHLSDRGIQELSGGERQLVMLARAAAQQAKLLILEEPTANLDYANQQLVLQHASGLASRGYTILFSTHNPEHALRYASHALVLKDHKIAAAGPASQVLTEEMFRTLYGFSVKIIEVPVTGGVIKSCIPVSALNKGGYPHENQYL